MTKEEAVKMLKAKLECMTRDVSGTDDDCNRKLCGECPLNYEKGNMGEQKECLRMSIDALEREPCEDAISRQAVLAIAGDSCLDLDSYEDTREFCDKIKELPPVTPQPKVAQWAILRDDYGDIVAAVCTNCHMNGRHEWAFCPGCGRKMQEVEE